MGAIATFTMCILYFWSLKLEGKCFTLGTPLRDIILISRSALPSKRSSHWRKVLLPLSEIMRHRLDFESQNNQILALNLVMKSLE